MNKGLVLGVALAIACAGAAAAEKHADKESCPMMKKGDKGFCCPMHAEMAKSMMRVEIVPTADGGVVVLNGGKLTKYDKELNLQKEAELKCDVEAVRAKVREMCAACPMNKKAMKEAEKAERCQRKMQEKKEREEKEHPAEAPVAPPAAQPAQ